MKHNKTERTEKIINAITWKMNDKMEGMSSLSTCPTDNEHCKKQAQIENSICSHCFSMTMNKRFANLRNKLHRNTELLTTEVIPTEEMPILNRAYFRFESFGDLINTIQVKNYFNLCKANPDTRFALWTKHPEIIALLLKTGEKKPKNLNIIYSSYMLNDRNDVIMNKYSFIDKVFTVYTSEYIKENSVKINCGANYCLGCLKCYKKNSVKHISEKLK